MINNIPTVQDYKDHGAEYLNIAWEGVMSLLVPYYDHNDADLEDEFGEAAQRRLAINIQLAFQGAEFLLKSKILEISPFFLISREPFQWPKKSAEINVDFSEFRTVDAQDLIKISNTVSPSRLSDSFMQQYEVIRVLRNSFAHTVKKDITVTAKEVLVFILESVYEFFPDTNWFSLRQECNAREAANILYIDDQYSVVLIKEAEILLNELTTSQIKRFFRFNKKQRRYLCPTCAYSDKWHILEYSKTAILSPNTPTSNEITCMVCDDITEVIRKECDIDDCKGNVIWQEKNLCLTCCNGDI